LSEVPPKPDVLLRQLVEAPSLARRRYTKAVRAATGLDDRPLQILAALALLGPSSVSLLARTLVLDPANTSTVLARLSSDGLVESETDPDDARRRTFWLSDEGRRRVARLLTESAKPLPAPGRVAAADS